MLSNSPRCTDIWLFHMFTCMKTTLNLDDDLMRTLKQKAAETGRTMTDMIEEAVREMLNRSAAEPGRHEFRWVTVRGRALPGVDITDRDSLLDAMEGRS